MRRRTPIILLALAVLASGVFLVSLDSHLTFVGDGWELLINRRDWSTESLLDPFHEHLLIGQALVYKLLVFAFGMGSAMPFYVVSICLSSLSAVLLFAYMRRRVGDWLALAGAVLVLFLGAASEDLLWDFQMGFFASIAAGLGMLLALDRKDRRGDRLACALLALSLAFSSIGVAFAGAGLADLALGRRPPRPRAYVAVLPLVVYLLWWLGWDQSAGTSASVHNLEQLPVYVFDAAAAGIASLFGRDPLASNGHPPVVAQIALVVFVILAAGKVARDRRISRGLAVALTLALCFWLLSGIDRNLSRYPTASRYQYPSAVFLLLVAAEVIQAIRFSRLIVLATATITAGAVFGGASLLQRDYDNFWKPTSDRIRATLTAANIAGASALAGSRVEFPPATTLPVETYLAVQADHGSPAFTERELMARPGPELQLVDRTIARLLGIDLRSAAGSHEPGPFRFLPSSGDGAASMRLGFGTFIVQNMERVPTAIRLGRFSSGFPVKLGRLGPERARQLTIPADESSRPWRLFSTQGPIRLCVAGEGAPRELSESCRKD